MRSQTTPYLPTTPITLHYNLHPTFQHRGYMKESVAAVLNFAFMELGAPSATIEPIVGNIASIKVSKTAGFTYIETEIDGFEGFEGNVDMEIWRLTRQEWVRMRVKGGRERMKSLEGPHQICSQ